MINSYFFSPNLIDSAQKRENQRIQKRFPKHQIMNNKLDF